MREAYTDEIIALIKDHKIKKVQIYNHKMYKQGQTYFFRRINKKRNSNGYLYCFKRIEYQTIKAIINDLKKPITAKEYFRNLHRESIKLDRMITAFCVKRGFSRSEIELMTQ